MEIILLASSMTSQIEHTCRFIHELGFALSACHLRHRIFCAKSAEPELVRCTGAIPHFSHCLYETPLLCSDVGATIEKVPLLGRLAFRVYGIMLSHCSTDGEAHAFDRYAYLEHRDWKKLNASFAADLLTLPRDVWSSENLVLVTATTQNQISGLVEFLRRCGTRLKANVVCHLMFSPEWSPAGRISKLGRHFYDCAFKRAAPLIGNTLFFTVENAAMRDAFEKTFAISAAILPVPMNFPKKSRRTRTPIHLGFYGYSKSDKGFHLLPEIVAICRERLYEVIFDIQIQHSGWEQATIDAEMKLRQLGNVNVIEGALSSAEYERAVEMADAILLPYDPMRFGMRGSSIFTEAITAGRPIIASVGTFAGDNVRLQEAHGIAFAPYSAEACANAIGELVTRYSELEIAALSRADEFRNVHNGEAYLKALLQFAPGSRASRRGFADHK